MKTTDKEAKEFWDMLNKLKKEADEYLKIENGKTNIWNKWSTNWDSSR